MRIAGSLMLAGCYSAAPPQDVPCDPIAPACPRGQQCVSGPTGYVCSNDPGIGDEPDGPSMIIDAGIDGPTTSSTTKTYNASVAECLDPMFPSAMACRQFNGNTQMVIDKTDSMTMGSWSAYMRFDLDSALAGKTITKITLRVTATSDGKAPGPDTGSVFRTSSFTKMSLEGTAPTLNNNALAGSQGSVQLNATVSWPLPTTLIGANTAAVFLAIVPNNDDGVNYYNTDGTTPPRLIVEAQ